MVADGLKGLNIIPTMGNHDTYPQDQIHIGGSGFEPAIKQWTPSWVQFMEDQKNIDTWMNYGYFYKKMTPNTTVISLNSNICYNLNFESWTAFNDSGHQLEWFQDLLSQIEEENGYAIVLAHVPNQDECTRQYARRYHAIVERYQHIVRFGVFSHTHMEQFQVMRSIYKGQPMGTSFIIGSTTTFQGKPPSFDIMYLDPDTMLPVDLETWAFDLDAANANDTLEWKLKIDHRKDYQLEDFSPASLMNLSERILKDEQSAC